MVPLFSLTKKENTMELRVDHSFHIGEQHLRNGKPNQDYALSDTLQNGLAYGIVSDGCSGGGLTDIGARLMALALKQALASGPPCSVVDRAQAYLDSMRRSLELETSDMLATGLFAIANQDGFVSTLVLGDGVMIEQSTRGTLYAHKYEWSDNTPFYMAYTEEQRQQFRDRKPTLTHEVWTISGPDSWTKGESGELSVGMATRKGAGWSYDPPQKGEWDLASVAVFSDGVLQVDTMPWQQVVFELMSFKSTNGQFATRRMNRFLQEAHKHGRGPLDDIAMAVVHLGR